MTGAFVWFEYVTQETKKAQGFFGELFGWGTRDVPMPEGAYSMIVSGERTIGGSVHTPPGAPEAAHWLAHLRVADVKAASEQLAALGGKLLKAPFKAGEFGTKAIAADPDGGAFALWQPSQSEPLPEPTNGTFCWNELTAKRPAEAVKFYSALGGFTSETKEMGGMGAYSVLSSSDGVPRAGIMGQPMPEAPHAWTPYVQVANADKTAERAKQLGATIVMPPTTVAGVGRFAILIDPQGAALGILQP